MIFHRPRYNLQLMHIGLVSIMAGLTGLAPWIYASIAALSTATTTGIYPTSIPWLLNQATCEKTDRSWRDEQCWDDQHDPNF